ncbi:ABC transporter ATP-binding protein [Barnesiella sp. WM24]|uniref:ABC transporter ATP-binding protein n=1 Tax=Barnesiella sp. WM24 TaxID=2558278 RepID=UPI000A8DE171|nr:ATP-binding cassette domain-containing protein [Barnesiella sp. WM24]TFU94954.1 ABC transporter ATP-binding protein [Barnesiella sp. WM24]
MEFIEVNDVVKDYSGHRALDHVSLKVKEGTVYGLLGPNGAGKTSLIRLLNQITRPDSGEIFLDGRPLASEDVMKIGYLPEERGLYKKMKVLSHIVYLGRLKGMTKSDAYREGRMWLERMGLEEWADKKIEALSKGMAQKVQFISTVVHRPRLLIFDEPFSGFDPVNTEQLKKEILRLNEEGATILFSTHNMASVEEVCEELSLINKSRVVLQGNVLDIRQQFKKNLFTLHIAEPVLAPDDSLFTIESITPHPLGGSEAIIRLSKGVTIKETIEKINRAYTLLGFEEVLPTMHEIFIETVTESNGQA